MCDVVRTLPTQLSHCCVEKKQHKKEEEDVEEGKKEETNSWWEHVLLSVRMSSVIRREGIELCLHVMSSIDVEENADSRWQSFTCLTSGYVFIP